MNHKYIKPETYSLFSNRAVLRDCATQITNSLDFNEVDCVEHKYAPTKENGYGQVRYQGKKYYCHVVMTIYGRGVLPVEGETASHRCGNKKCINPYHLCFEDIFVNQSRMCCFMFLFNHAQYVCPHHPACVMNVF